MTTSFELDATLEFATRTGTMKEATAPEWSATVAEPIMPPTAPEAAVTATATATAAAAATEADGLICGWDAEDRSTLSAASIGVQCRRALRMRAPFLIADVLALVLAALIAQGAMWLIYPPAAACLGLAAPLALLPLIIAYGLSALYSEIWVHPVIEFRQLTHVSTVGLVAAAVGGTLAWPFPLWCVAAWMGTVVFVPLLRTLARYFCVNRRWWGYPTLVIGSGNGASDVARMLLEAPRSGLIPVMMTDPDDRCRASALPVINDPATLESLLRNRGISHAVVSLPHFSSARLGEVLDRYSGLVPHLMVMSDAATLPTLWGASRCIGRLSGIEVRNGLLLATLQGVKRAFDLAVAIAALCVSLPLLLAIMPVMKLTSRGPIFFGHTRIGRHGRRFKAWKFRTMHPNGDAILREYLQRVVAAQEEWARDRKLRKDPRVTRFGALLRKLSLDELPQIWNVLRGDMSIVGPRPIVESEVKLYGDVFRQYTSVKPGITGLWQVSGRTNLSYDDRVLLDQFYIRHWSPWLDVYILAKTVVSLLKRDGAY
jgi:Undecaprenyl-phosphate galactose phosphotransferase WbaP